LHSQNQINLFTVTSGGEQVEHAGSNHNKNLSDERRNTSYELQICCISGHIERLFIFDQVDRSVKRDNQMGRRQRVSVDQT
jgi:hypothetical protein